MATEVSPAVLLDTHTVIWWQSESARLSKAARKRIENASKLLVSPITFWELAMLVEKRRVQLDRSTAAWVNDFIATDRLAVAELSSAVAVAAAELVDFHGDPADRIIVASAIAAGVHLVTKDANIRTWAKTSKRLSTIW